MTIVFFFFFRLFLERRRHDDVNEMRGDITEATDKQGQDRLNNRCSYKKNRESIELVFINVRMTSKEINKRMMEEEIARRTRQKKKN